jgi:uncharacterized coiled-coil protein SlyX
VLASVPGSPSVAAAVAVAGGSASAEELIANLGEGEEAIDRLLEALVGIKRQQRTLEEQLNALLDRLQQLHESGEVDSTFHFNDTAFSWSPGRVQFTYPEPVLALEQQLKLARKTAEGNGTAVRRHGRPFWTIKLPSA